jgi:hypothetical protein
MKNLLVATAMAVAMIEAAHAATYTYMCRDHHKRYPVTLDTGKNDTCDGATTSCTIMWRGTKFQNVKQGEGCRAEYLATDNGVSVDLCTATQGVAVLKIGNKTFDDCQMPRH